MRPNPWRARAPRPTVRVVDEPVRRSGATWFLVALTALLTALPVASAVQSLLRLTGVLEVDREAALRDGLAAVGLFGDERGLRVAEGFAAGVTVPVSLVALAVLYGLVAWRDWAREAALGVFGLVGAGLLVLSLAGATADPPGRNAGWGVLGSLLLLGVAALAVSPPVRRDWERKQIEREVEERARLTAERQARQQSRSPSRP